MARLLLSGGLGNQLFQYAACYARCREIGSSLILDLRYYERVKGQSKQCHLAKFAIEASFAKAGVQSIIGQHNPLVRALRLFTERPRRYVDPELGYRQLHFKNNAVVSGLFQSPLYFAACEAELRSQLDIMPDCDLEIAGIPIHEFRAIHVRRGDYLTHNGFMLPNVLGYYVNAIEASGGRRSGPFLIFSDDHEWVRAQPVFQGKHFHLFDSQYALNDPVIEMLVMSHCKSLAIANSTFSWWAAWLAGRRPKKIFAPAIWIGNIPAENIRIYPSYWEAISW